MVAVDVGDVTLWFLTWVWLYWHSTDSSAVGTRSRPPCLSFIWWILPSLSPPPINEERAAGGLWSLSDWGFVRKGEDEKIYFEWDVKTNSLKVQVTQNSIGKRSASVWSVLSKSRKNKDLLDDFVANSLFAVCEQRLICLIPKKFVT